MDDWCDGVVVVVSYYRGHWFIPPRNVKIVALMYGVMYGVMYGGYLQDLCTGLMYGTQGPRGYVRGVCGVCANVSFFGFSAKKSRQNHTGGREF